MLQIDMSSIKLVTLFTINDLLWRKSI